jgi:hypothetical protein
VGDAGTKVLGMLVPLDLGKMQVRSSWGCLFIYWEMRCGTRVCRGSRGLGEEQATVLVEFFSVLFQGLFVIHMLGSARGRRWDESAWEISEGGEAVDGARMTRPLSLQQTTTIPLLALTKPLKLRDAYRYMFILLSAPYFPEFSTTDSRTYQKSAVDTYRMLAIPG